MADPAQRIGEIDLLGAAERARLLVAGTRPRMRCRRRRCPSCSRRRWRQAPDATALVYEDVTLSYAELNARANRLAHMLIGMGIGPEHRVALCLERSPQMVVALLAVLKAGAAYVPLDPDYPAERLAFMLADARPKAVVTTTALAAGGLFADGATPLVLLDDAAGADALAAAPDTDPTDAERLAPLRRNIPPM